MVNTIFEHRGFLLLIPALVFLSCSTAVAQSGRRAVAPSPSASPTPTPSETPVSKESEAPVARPASVIITGSTISDSGGYHSSVSTATEEIIDMFKLFRLPSIPVKGGKMTKQEAMERATRETDAYVLWLQIAVKTDINAIEGVVLDRVYFSLFLPKTGKVLQQGEVDPYNIVQTNEQGTRTPRMTRTRSRTMGPYLRASAREVFRRVRGVL